MSFIEPSPDQLSWLVAAGSAADARPILMLNLLRFAERAVGAGEGEDMSGREAYERYGQAATVHLERVGGSVVQMYESGQTVIGPEAEAWDLLILVRYPSAGAFLEMVSDPSYQAAARYRSAALADSRLICFTAPA